MNLVSGIMFVIMLITAFVYYIVPKKAKPYTLLIISIAFYISLGWQPLIFIVFSSITTYIAGILLENKENKTIKRVILAITVILNGLILVILKNQIFVKNIIVPMGISYYTFQVISYIADIYKKKYEAQKNLAKYFLYTMYFPYLSIGPINRYNDITPTLYETDKKFNGSQAFYGLLRILFGIFKKLVVANRIQILIATITGDTNTYQGAFALFAMLLYSIELYCDFSGGIDVVIGFSKILQIKIMENFNNPYISENIQEFWRRWHISLSNWFRDYVYIPLGGSRCGNLRTNINVLIVFVLSGLWHGTQYVLWGLLHGIFLLLGKVVKTPWKIVNRVITFLIVSILWAFFIWPNTVQACQMIASVFTQFNYQALIQSIGSLGLSLANYIVLIIATIMVFTYEGKKKVINEKIKNKEPEIKLILTISAILIILVFGVYGIGFDASQFIYNKF